MDSETGWESYLANAKQMVRVSTTMTLETVRWEPENVALAQVDYILGAQVSTRTVAHGFASPRTSPAWDRMSANRSYFSASGRRPSIAMTLL